jgi:hypothetical protein
MVAVVFFLTHWILCGTARISIRVVKQFWFSYPLRSFSGVFLFLGRHRKFATPRGTNPRKARKECTAFSQRNGIQTVRNHKRIFVLRSVGLSGPTGSLAPRDVMGTFLWHFTEDAKPLLPAFAFMSCADTTLPLTYVLFTHTLSLYYIVPSRKNLMQVIWYAQVRRRKHFFHDYHHACCVHSKVARGVFYVLCPGSPRL